MHDARVSIACSCPQPGLHACKLSDKTPHRCGFQVSVATCSSLRTSTARSSGPGVLGG